MNYRKISHSTARSTALAVALSILVPAESQNSATASAAPQIASEGATSGPTATERDAAASPGDRLPASSALRNLPRTRFFELADTQSGVTTLTVDGALVTQFGKRTGRFVLEGFPLPRAGTIDLELRPFRVAGDRTRFVVGRMDGPDVALDFDPSSITFFTGAVAGYPGSSVFLALSDKLSTGTIDLGPGRATFRLSSQLGRGRAVGAGKVAIFPTTTPGRAIDVPLCGIEALEHHGIKMHVVRDESAGSITANGTVASAGSNPIKGLRTIELAVDTDYEYYELFQDVDAAAAYVTALVGAISQVYIRDTNYRFELTFVRIWDTPDDLYNEPGQEAFFAFVDHWQNNMGFVGRDVAHLLSGRRDLPFGGIAFLDVVCGNFAYGMAGYILGFFPDPETPSVYHYDMEVSGHELGHNCGSPHTDGYNPPIDQCFPPPGIPQRGTIMSYCSQGVSGGNAVHEMRFHARVQAEIMNSLSGVSCVIDDCNQNNVDDATDITNMSSADANGNGVPDECEDCNGNGTLDTIDILLFGLADLNSNGIPDVCEPDCNNNAVPDDRDILLGTSPDAYGNNVPDECEEDRNGNGVSDFTEIQADLTLDINRNTILDLFEDCDNDGTPDFVELDGAHNVWITSDTLNLLGEYHADTGVLVKNAESGVLSGPQDVAISRSGRIFVTSALDDRVVEFDRSGAYVGDFVGAGGGGLDYPTGILIAPNGNVLVSSRNTNSVIEYNGETGSPMGAFVSPTSGGLSAPFGLATGPNGDLFVTSGDNRVMQYDGQTGTFVGVFVSLADNGGLLDPRGMAFLPDGNLLVAGFVSDALNEYDGSTGAFLRIFHNGGTVYGPWGVRVGPNGNVYMTRDYEGPLALNEMGDDAPQPLHATTTRIYEYEPVTGNHLRSYLLGDDTGLFSPTGFAFMPGSATDCNVNFVQDSCDIASGVSLDLNSDTTPDECGACCQSGACAQLVQTACEASPLGDYRGDQTACASQCQGQSQDAIPAVSDWGVGILLLLTVTAATLVYGRGRCEVRCERA